MSVPVVFSVSPAILRELSVRHAELEALATLGRD